MLRLDGLWNTKTKVIQHTSSTPRNAVQLQLWMSLRTWQSGCSSSAPRAGPGSKFTGIYKHKNYVLNEARAQKRRRFISDLLYWLCSVWDFLFLKTVVVAFMKVTWRRFDSWMQWEKSTEYLISNKTCSSVFNDVYRVCLSTFRTSWLLSSVVSWIERQHKTPNSDWLVVSRNDDFSNSWNDFSSRQIH